MSRRGSKLLILLKIPAAALINCAWYFSPRRRPANSTFASPSSPSSPLKWCSSMLLTVPWCSALSRIDFDRLVVGYFNKPYTFLIVYLSNLCCKNINKFCYELNTKLLIVLYKLNKANTFWQNNKYIYLCLTAKFYFKYAFFTLNTC